MSKKKPKPAPRRQRTEGAAYLVAGSAGSGKSSWTRQQVADAERLLVWDSAQEWTRDRAVFGVPTLAQLGAYIIEELKHGAGAMRAGYCGPVSAAHFETFCRLAWIWLRAHPRGALVVEELADVTTPGKAPPAWGEIVRKHRHTQGRVYALTQRPAESDKTIVGNAAVIHTGRMNFASDREYMARCLDLPVAEIAALPDLAFIERNMRTREIKRGTVKFSQ